MIADEIRDELDELGVASVAPGLAAVALSLAESLDAIPIDKSPTSRALVADKLAALMARLHAMAPVKEEGDAVDDITRQREKRRAAARDSAESSG